MSKTYDYRVIWREHHGLQPASFNSTLSVFGKEGYRIVAMDEYVVVFEKEVEE